MNTDFLTDIFANDDVTVEALYTDPNGEKSFIRVVFESAYSRSVAAGVPSDNLAPHALCRRADIEGVKKACTLVIDETTYYVIDVQPAGTGTIDLILSKDA